MEYEVTTTYSTSKQKCQFSHCANNCVLIVSGNTITEDESYRYTNFCESHLCKRCEKDFDNGVTICQTCDLSRCRAPDCKELIGIYHFYCDKHFCHCCGSLNTTNNRYCTKCYRMCPGCSEYIEPMTRCRNCTCTTNKCTKMKTANSLFCESCLHKNNMASMRNKWLTK
jgi:hypothetical protein